MIITAVVGERRAGPNTPADLRAGAFSELIVNDSGLGRYFEAVRNKRMFGLSAVGFTIVAANAGALAAALQPIVGFINPIGNTRAAVVQRVTTQTRSGTPGGPLYVVGGITTAAISTASAGTFIDLSLQGAQSTMKPYNNVALTGYTANTVGAYQLPIGGPAAIAAGAGAYQADSEIAGMAIVPPGGIFAVTASAVGTTHIVDAALVIAEIDWPL